MGRRLAGMAALGLLAALVGVPPPAAAVDVPRPTVTGPVGDAGVQGHPLFDSPYDLSQFGYVDEEYFVSGTATSEDGATADYTTRMIVFRPEDPAEFAGTVMLDWTNVTAQFENAVDSVSAMPFLLREGWAWVHVSAQAAGVCCSPLTPSVWDPVRYADLDHPGDEFANDMFSQLASTFTEPGDIDPMGGLEVEVVLAAGQSQSANRLTDYVATTQAEADVIDGFLVQAEGSKQYAAAPAVPVLHLLGDREATPEDPTPWPTYRLWEIAAASHQDLWIGRYQVEAQGPRVAGAPKMDRTSLEALWQSAGNYGEQVDPRTAVCIVNGAAFPNRYAVDAALASLDRWVRDGVAPTDGPRYQFDEAGMLAADDLGNTLGGIRLPPVEVPVARYVSTSCNLGGMTFPLTEPELIDRHGNHAAYYDAIVDATRGSVADGRLLPADAVDLLTRACAAANRFPGTVSDCDPAPDVAAAGLGPFAAPAGPGAPAPSPATDDSDPAADPAPPAGQDPATEPAPAPPAASPSPAPTSGSGAGLPATGAGLAGAALAVALLSRRRR